MFDIFVLLILHIDFVHWLHRFHPIELIFIKRQAYPTRKRLNRLQHVLWGNNVFHAESFFSSHLRLLLLF